MRYTWNSFASPLITGHMAKTFLMSPDVIEKRLEKDGIKKKYCK
jgi:hypothetical protein